MVCLDPFAMFSPHVRLFCIDGLWKSALRKQNRLRSDKYRRGALEADLISTPSARDDRSCFAALRTLIRADERRPVEHHRTSRHYPGPLARAEFPVPSRFAVSIFRL